MHDVTMTLCAPSIKMYTRINMFLQVSKPFVGQTLPETITLRGKLSKFLV